MEEGLLPHIRSLDSGSPEELEEERRLFYVGLTRAEQKLFLTRAFRRGFRGTYEPTVPSRFLSDIPASSLINNLPNNKSSKPSPETPDSILDFRRDQSKRKISSRVITNTSNTDRSLLKPVPKKRTVNKINISRSNGAPKFQIGDKVIHGQFGNGIVMSCDPSGDDLQITVAFKDGGGIKKLLQSLAKLKKI
jgi:DNA helicase-2/ATP-dependent DNA helicase PcrA